MKFFKSTLYDLSVALFVIDMQTLLIFFIGMIDIYFSVIKRQEFGSKGFSFWKMSRYSQFHWSQQ